MSGVAAPVVTESVGGNCRLQKSSSAARLVSFSEHAHTNGVVALLRGAGASTLKFAALSPSGQPPTLRIAAVELLSVPVGAVPSKQLAVGPNPTTSRIAPPVGHRPTSGTTLEVKATLPVVPDIEIAPIASGGGRGPGMPEPAASWTRK